MLRRDLLQMARDCGGKVSERYDGDMNVTWFNGIDFDPDAFFKFSDRLIELCETATKEGERAVSDAKSNGRP